MGRRLAFVGLGLAAALAAAIELLVAASVAPLRADISTQRFRGPPAWMLAQQERRR